MQTDLGVAHVAFDFALWRKGCHGVDDDDVDGTGTNQIIRDFEGLFTVIGLRNKQFGGVHAQFFGVETVEGMFRVNERSDSALLLRFRDGMDGQRSLTRRFRSVNLYDSAFREAAHAQRGIQADGTSGNHVHLFDVGLAHAHDRAFSESFFKFFECGIEYFQFLSIHIVFNFFFFHF